MFLPSGESIVSLAYSPAAIEIVKSVPLLFVAISKAFAIVATGADALPSLSSLPVVDT